MTIQAPDRRTFLSSTLALGSLALLPKLAFAQNSDLSKEAVLDDPDVPVLGNPNGNVALVEWFDYQCPYCKKAHPEIMKLVREDGNIRLVMKDWPIFGPSSLYASRLALAAGQHHEKALSALMATEARLSQQEVEEALTEAGFSIEALNAAYGRDQARIDGIIARNGAQAESFGFMGTPAYIAGTTVFPGVPDMGALRQAIDHSRS
jgi:protein-disulfide isomerase